MPGSRCIVASVRSPGCQPISARSPACHARQSLHRRLCAEPRLSADQRPLASVPGQAVAASSPLHGAQAVSRSAPARQRARPGSRCIVAPARSQTASGISAARQRAPWTRGRPRREPTHLTFQASLLYASTDQLLAGTFQLPIVHSYQPPCQPPDWLAECRAEALMTEECMVCPWLPGIECSAHSDRLYTKRSGEAP